VSKFELWCGNVPLSTYGLYGDLTATFQWGPDVVGGLQSVEWTQPRLAGAKVFPPEYVTGTQLELRDSGMVVGQVILSTPDFNEGSFTAWGIAQAPTKLTPNAMDDDYAPVYNLHDAVVYAIERGKLPGWRDPGDLSTTDLRTLTDGNQLDGNTSYSVADIIKTYCRSVSATTRAYIDAAGFLRFAEDATTPGIVLRDVDPFMLTSDNYVDTLVTDYQTFTVDPDTSAFTKARVVSTRPTPSGLTGVEQNLDITNQGSLTEEQAQESSDTALARLLPDYDRDGSRDVIQRQVTDIHGTEIPFTMIPLGVKVKHPGARLAGGSVIPGLADEWTLGTMVIQSSQGRITGATLTPLTSTTNVLQTIYSTAVQAQITATQANNTANTALNSSSDPLAALITPDSKITIGGTTAPTGASTGDCWQADDGTYWVFDGTTWQQATAPSTTAIIAGLVFTSNAFSTLLGGFTVTSSASTPSGTATGSKRWIRISGYPNVVPSSTVLGAWQGNDDGTWTQVYNGTGTKPDWVANAVITAAVGAFGLLTASGGFSAGNPSAGHTTIDSSGNITCYGPNGTTVVMSFNTSTGALTINGYVPTGSNSTLAATLTVNGTVKSNGSTTYVEIDGANDQILFKLSSSTAATLKAASLASGPGLECNGGFQVDGDFFSARISDASSTGLTLTNPLVNGTLNVSGQSTLNLPAASSTYGFARSNSGILYARTLANTQSDLGISAEQFKSNIADLDFPLEDGYALRPVTFTLTYPDGSVRDGAGGFIADDTPESLADLLVTFFDADDGDELDKKVKGFDYLMGLAAVQQRLIQDLNDRLTAAEAVSSK